MSVLGNCTPEEVKTFEAIAHGGRVEEQDQEAVKTLLAKNLLSDHDNMITVPAIVWGLYKKEQDQSEG